MYAASIMSMRNDGRFFQAVPCINLGHRPFEEWVLEMCIKNINAASTVIPGVEKKGSFIMPPPTPPLNALETLTRG